jgi:hypothetical protein
MTKSLLYRLFGIGKIPDALRIQPQSEGMVLLDEGVKGSVTYRNFHAPGRRDAWRRQWYTGSIALTKMRLVALWYNNPLSPVVHGGGCQPSKIREGVLTSLFLSA